MPLGIVTSLSKLTTIGRETLTGSLVGGNVTPVRCETPLINIRDHPDFALILMGQQTLNIENLNHWIRVTH